MPSEQMAILVVDDERSVTDLLAEDLAEEGYNCVAVTTGEDALKRLAMDNFDAVLLDLRLPGIYGMDVLKEAKSTYPETEVIIVTAVGDAQTAVEAMKLGAVDYITKPFELAKLNSSLEAALKAKTVRSNRPAAKAEGTEVRGEEVDWTRYLDNIAKGVSIKLDSLTGHIMTITVIEKTISIAQRLSIPEKQIDKWAQAKRKETIDESNLINWLSEKLERNFIAQVVLGMTEPHCNSGDNCPN